MRILVVGAGATGGYFGARLARAGRDVTFLVRERRASSLASGGLRVRSPHGDFTVEPRLLTTDRIETPFDLVLLSVKAFSLERAADDFAHAIGPDTCILPMLNGMRHLELLDGRFGRERVLGGTARILATLGGAGEIVHLAGVHELLYGERDGSVSERIRAIDRELRDAGFDAILSDRIEQDMWDKWVLLASLGGITCLMRGTIGQIEAVPSGSDFQNAFVDELAGIAASLGHPCADPTIATIRRVLTQPGSPMTSSMYRDLEAGQQVEADQILGDLLRRAREARIPAPLLTAAATHLAVYQSLQR